MQQPWALSLYPPKEDHYHYWVLHDVCPPLQSSIIKRNDIYKEWLENNEPIPNLAYILVFFHTESSIITYIKNSWTHRY